MTIPVAPWPMYDTLILKLAVEIDRIHTRVHIAGLIQQLEAVKAENERFRKTLSLYADKKHLTNQAQFFGDWDYYSLKKQQRINSFVGTWLWAEQGGWAREALNPPSPADKQSEVEA